MITVALSKGRLFEDFIEFLDQQGLSQYGEILNEDGRFLFKETDNVKFLFAKGRDVPVYVEEGIADLGIVGEDILDENPKNVLKLVQLPFGICRLCLCGPPGLKDRDINSVATSFPNLSHKYFIENRKDVEIVFLNGSVELSPILGLTDAIVDIVQTGNTLRENGLIEYQTIMPVQARLIGNRQTFYTKEEEIYDFIDTIGVF